MTLNQLADELLEIRRYVRTHPDHVKEMLGDLPGMSLVEDRDLYMRLCGNIEVGVSRILHNPEILEGYLYGAAAEIRELAMKQEAGE
jgi:hypothetical protein